MPDDHSFLRVNAQVRLILDSAAERILGCESDGTCTFSNQAAADLLAYQDPAELLGKNMHATEHHSRPDGRPYPLEECPIYHGLQNSQCSLSVCSGTHQWSEASDL